MKKRKNFKKAIKEGKFNLDEILRDENYKLGKFRRNQKGFGFVNIGDDENEIYIAPKLTKNALDGDSVLIRIFNDVCFENELNQKREGKIIKILEILAL